MTIMCGCPIFQTTLLNPQDASWLAHDYPEVFGISSHVDSVIEIHNMCSALALTGDVELTQDEDGFLLTVDRKSYELMLA